MDPMDIPTEVTELVYTAPWTGSRYLRTEAAAKNEAAAQLAHYWPAIEAHIRKEVADEIAALPTANDGQLIAATRDQILGAIRADDRPT